MNGRLWRAPAAAVLAYAGAALAALVEGVLVLRLWRADLRVPFNARGDSVFFAMMVKATVDNGWYLTNPQLGAPGELTLHDFPQADGLHLLIFKSWSWLSTDWALLFNLYFLLGFPLITLSAFAVLRHFRVASVPAFVVSLLYAFLPSRLILGESHLFLTAFFQVPLAILLSLWVAGDDPPLFAPGRRAWRPALALRRRRSIAAIAIALLVSGTGVYYAFFAGVLILAAGASSALARRSSRHALAAVALTAVIFGGLAVQSVPTLLYHRAMGRNPALATRPAGEAERYALKIAPLLLPVSGHRIPALAALKDRYDRASATTGEVSATSLGVVGAAGFLILIAMLIWRGHALGDRQSLLSTLARLNLVALLLATTGGFGALFALLVSPQIRTYARLHVYIAFYAFFCVALLLDRLWRSRRRTGVLVTVAVAFVGLSDQVAPQMTPPYRQRARDYHADAAFIHGLEAQVRPGAQIFQLPYLRFPESGGVPDAKLVDYDPLQPYLHSRALRWSYPAMFGRAGDAWSSALADQPAAELVRALSDAGFDGILVNRDGYVDDGAAVLAALGDALGDAPAPTTAGRHVFFDLGAENERSFAGMPRDERERRRRDALDRPLLSWGSGFFPPEQGPDGAFRWCSGDCEIQISNGTERAARVSLSMWVAPGQPPASLQVTSDLWTETVALAPGGTRISRALLVPVGRHPINLRSDGAPVISSQDARRLIFRVDDTHLRPMHDAR